MPDEPDYKVYRSRPGRSRTVEDGLQELRDQAPEVPRRGRAGPNQPEYIKHSRRRPSLRLPSFNRRRVVKWVLTAIGGWLLLSLLLFLVSAFIQRQNTSDAARSALSGSGYTLTSANTILVLGSDARQPGTKEPGANVGGPSRSDSIMLIRAGGGKSAKLSIPRDTIVDIPGHGPDKVNAAYAIGGPSLTIRTLENYLGIEINHLVEVDFGNFPDFIDALGGITVRTNCVRSDINGGRRNGGTSLRLKPGEHHLNGEQALTLARTRKNDCRPGENDLMRAKRQQDVLSAIKSRLVSPAVFFRLPLVAWEAPKAIKSDMGGPTLLGLFGAIQIGGDPKPQVLGGLQLGGGVGATEAEKQAAVRKFLRG